eukprot:CCRYP_021041-RA/>CCRYP_021041-RA protein AED:0.84 eAED:0.84 QI:0/0/0/0.5/0/0.5/2/0/217
MPPHSAHCQPQMHKWQTAFNHRLLNSQENGRISKCGKDPTDQPTQLLVSTSTISIATHIQPASVSTSAEPAIQSSTTENWELDLGRGGRDAEIAHRDLVNTTMATTTTTTTMGGTPGTLNAQQPAQQQVSTTGLLTRTPLSTTKTGITAGAVDNYAIVDSGASDNYLTPTANMKSKTTLHQPIQVTLPDQSTLRSSHTCQLDLSLPLSAKQATSYPA